MIIRKAHLISWFSLVFLASTTAGLYSCLNTRQPTGEVVTTPRVLVFSKTKGWKHTSIPFAEAAIRKLGSEHNFEVDTTKNAAYFTDDSLKHYAAVIFNSTTGNVLNQEQQAAFERYIQAGGGYMGIHSAADTEYEWPWYNKLMGAHFASHPLQPGERQATVEIINKNHPATAALPDQWVRTDEWYNYRSFYAGINVLANLDENTYEGGTNGAYHPIAWYHAFDGGRAFYTGGGHTPESYRDPLFIKHLLGGIQYVLGDNKPLDYRKAYAGVVPEENRFVKTVLVNDLSIPMELAVAQDGRVFYTELRTGNLMVFNTRNKQQALVHQFKVATKGGTGLIGVTLDPNFAQNNFIYLYYAPFKEQEPYIFNLSRFTLKPDNTLDAASEKILLQVPVQENSGSHHGGSLAWDKAGNLYLSTGDSTTPFPSEGYAPLDERPGPEFYAQDAQRSSANTNDFKGKILRIHPEPNGTYTVPDGNLFPKGTPQTRPEIYTMGLRNPYRIAVNPRTSVLYWGEIGPDAGRDSIQGPRGYDEFNQAKKPGNYGWPYFIGNNFAYADWDFAAKTAGSRFNPLAPVNNSPNNTGLKNLPPAVPAMIYYPYAASKEFPELGQGGRSAMAGEFYTYNPNAASQTKFPAYYDGTLFVMEWMRNWVMALRFDKDENFVRAEPFMTLNGDFRRPIDLAFGADGVMYLLEYGSVYGADNEDARLVKIEYNTDNRAPVAQAFATDSVAAAQASARSYLTSDPRFGPMRPAANGPVPLRVNFSSRGTKDLDDDDQITYQWLFDGQNVGSTNPNPGYTYTQPGVYQAILKVTDKAGLVGTDTVVVSVGNAAPAVTITTPNNKSFYWDNKPFTYAVKVSDKEDKTIDSKKVKIYFDYNPQPSTLAKEAPMGHQLINTVQTNSLGKTLIDNSDCKACHTVDKVSVGPALTAVARRYKGQPGALERLAAKIINGGGGNWGTEHVMSAHPQVPVTDAQEMVKYIFSLTDAQKPKTTLPATGKINFNQHTEKQPNGQYTLLATYTDNGGKEIGPLTGTDAITLRPAKVRTIDTDAQVGFRRFGDNLTLGDHKSYFLLKNIDLTGIKRFTYAYAAAKNGEVEVRAGSFAGPVISRVAFKANQAANGPQTITGELNKPVTGHHDLYFILVRREKPNNELAVLRSIQFEQ